MSETILDSIPFELDISALSERLRVKEGSRYAERFRRLVAEAEDIARPKAFYRVAFVDPVGDNRVVIDEVTLTSRVLRVNLDQIQRVFPYVATCGVELERWANALDDMMERYWSEEIRMLALRAANQALTRDLRERYRLDTLSSMSPGSLSDWPLRQQRVLFRILGDTEAAVGVRLRDSLLMVPSKSVSGIRFPTETTFESCQLCPREGCPQRRAPYDQNLYDEQYEPVNEPVSLSAG